MVANQSMDHPTPAEILGYTVNTILLIIAGLQGCIAIITNMITMTVYIPLCVYVSHQ